MTLARAGSKCPRGYWLQPLVEGTERLVLKEASPASPRTTMRGSTPLARRGCATSGAAAFLKTALPAVLRHSRNFLRIMNDLLKEPLPLDGGGWEGVKVAATSKRGRKNRQPLHVTRNLRVLGGITPTLPRPHRGGGDKLKICEFRCPAVREREDPARGAGWVRVGDGVFSLVTTTRSPLSQRGDGR